MSDFHWFKRVHKVLSLILFLSVWGALDFEVKAEDSSSSPAVAGFNIPDLAAADSFGREFVTQYLRKYGHLPPAERPRVSIVHVGNYLPRQLRWIRTHLAKAKIEIKGNSPQLLDARQFEESVARYAQYPEAFRLAYGAESTPEALAGTQVVPVDAHTVAQRTRLLSRWLFGMPEGLPAGVTFLETDLPAEDRKNNIKLANQQSLIGGTNLAVAFYVKSLAERAQGHDSGNIHYVTGGVVLAMWIWVNMYKNLWLGNYTGSGIDAPESRDANGNPQWLEEQGMLFFRTSRFLISFATFIFVPIAVYWDQAFTPSTVGVAFTTALMSLVSRTFGDEWINRRQKGVARQNEDPTVLKTEFKKDFRERLRAFWRGPHSTNTTRKTRAWWEVINAMFTNLHLINVARQATVVSGWKAQVASTFATLAPMPFYALTATGLVLDTRRYRHELKRFFSVEIPGRLARHNVAQQARQENMFEWGTEEQLELAATNAVMEYNARRGLRCETLLVVEEP